MQKKPHAYHMHSLMLSSNKNSRQESPVLWTSEIQGAQHRIPLKKHRFPSCPRAKVRCQEPPDAARAQPCSDRKKVTITLFIIIGNLKRILNIFLQHRTTQASLSWGALLVFISTRSFNKNSTNMNYYDLVI